jgi:hypothetical protein
MLEQKGQISGGLCVQAYHWPITSTVPEDYVLSKQPVPFFLIVHPSPEGGVPGSISKHPLSHLISVVDIQSHHQTVLKIRTIVLVVNSGAWLSLTIQDSYDQ